MKRELIIRVVLGRNFNEVKKLQTTVTGDVNNNQLHTLAVYARDEAERIRKSTNIEDTDVQAV